MKKTDGDQKVTGGLTAYDDIPMSVRAMKAGAIEFLPEPLRDQDTARCPPIRRQACRIYRLGAWLLATFCPLRDVSFLALVGRVVRGTAKASGSAKHSMGVRRRFPPPWQVEEGSESFTIRDANGQALAYVYFEDEPVRQMSVKRLSQDEARRIAVNITKLPDLLMGGAKA